MSNNTSNNQSNKELDQVDFVLKHRIVGAAFLLFFGALFLPWLLGAPSEATKLPLNVAAIERQADPDVNEVLTDQVSTPIAAQEPEVEEVYISKITPLNRGQGATEVEVESEANSEVQSTGQDSTQAALDKSLTKTLALSQARKTAVPVPKPSIVAEDSRAKPVKKSDKSATVSPNATDKSNPEVSLTDRDTSVEVGWVVQVGVFTDKRGAAKVVDDLRDKGFIPSTSIVDTNRGKATGTRIWLGPYAQRVEAAKAKTLLTNKTGEAGFIRAYP
jgi:cell division septation protein DedD